VTSKVGQDHDVTVGMRMTRRVHLIVDEIDVLAIKREVLQPPVGTVGDDQNQFGAA